MLRWPETLLDEKNSDDKLELHVLSTSHRLRGQAQYLNENPCFIKTSQLEW